MCGIAGYIGRKKLPQVFVKNTLKLMSNRGPDNQDFFYYQNNNGYNIYLLSSRLSIVNQDQNSNQPFRINEYVIVYNGEIYNFLDLRKKLIKKGIKVKTSSDTEVILHYFILYGEKCLKYFEGMWSFVILNIKNNKIFSSRDRFGEKPLFYLENSTKDFYFGSEIKFIQSLYDKKININLNQLTNYLNFGYKSLYKYNQTYFQNIKEFPKRSFIYSKIGERLSFRNYWKLNFLENDKISESEAIKETRLKVIDSIEKRINANVPVGICLSGGVDSSIIASVAKKILNKNIKTYSILDNDIRYSEKRNIKLIINDLKVKNTSILLKKEKNFERLKKLIEYRTAPISTISYYNHSLMLEKMKKDKIKVGVLGTAADEVFGGYYDHFLLQLSVMNRNKKNNKLFNSQKLFFNKFAKKFIRNPLLKDPYKYIKNPKSREHIFDEYKKLGEFLISKSNKKFSEIKFTNDLLRNRMLNELNIETTPVTLNDDDLNSMNYSIENRSPYLDSSLVEFAYTLPSELLIKNGYNKYLLRQAFKDVVCKKVILDKKKIGFNSSINDVFDLKNKYILKQILDKNSPIFDFIKYDEFKKIINQKKYENYLSKFIFSFINANIFLQKFY